MTSCSQSLLEKVTRLKCFHCREITLKVFDQQVSLFTAVQDV